MVKKKSGAGTDDLISISQAAELRGVSPQAIDDLLRRERLQSVEVAGRRLLRRGDVENFTPARKRAAKKR